MKVIVSYALRFRDITGKDTEEIRLNDGLTVGDLIEILSLKYGTAFREEFRNPSADMISGNVLILVNGKVVTDFRTGLRDGDKVDLTYVVSGG